jgi:transcriptional regulator with XRE-family HTH domain
MLACAIWRRFGVQKVPSDEQRKILGSFLVDRRARLDPAHAGFAVGRRRTPGLRREEVAQLAGVSVSWYTWLEQGREIRASAGTLDRVAEALRLDYTERVHLFALSERRPPGAPPDDSLSNGLLLLLRALDPVPAYIRNTRLDIVAWNGAIADLFTDYGALPPQERNTLRLLFLHAPYRRLIVDWELVARGTLATFRAAQAQAADKAPFRVLADDLIARSVEFRLWWPDHDVRLFDEGVKRLDHPVHGLVDLTYVSMVPENRRDLSLVTYIPRLPY